MPTSVQQIRDLVHWIRELSGASRTGKQQLQDLARAVENLIVTQSRPTGQVSTFSVGISREQITQLRQYISDLDQMGGVFQQIAYRAANAAQQIGQLSQAQRRYRLGGLGLQIPAGGQIQAPPMPISGTLEELQAFMGGPKVKTLPLALASAVQDIKNEYESLGFTLDKTKISLDLTNEALTVQARLVNELAPGIKAVTEATKRVSPTTGEILPESTPAATLEKLLGTQKRLDEFRNRLRGMGLSMQDLHAASESAATGVKQFTFRMVDGNRVVRTATFTFDRFGRELGDTTTRFKSFEQMILRNIGKVTEWGIAVEVVFGAYRRMQDVFANISVLQESVTDLAIVTGEGMSSISGYFTEVAKMASDFGVSVTDSMEAVIGAMRATGGSVEAERAADAFVLLGDAMAYARLTGIDMNQATDILVSSLKQMGYSITEGEQLMEKWLAVSKEAKVTMVDLGKAYSITAAAAEMAGVSQDQLNAYIAVMAEVTNKSATEGANAVRAMFAAIQTPSTQKTLEQHGIIVKDINDNYRSMADILDDIGALLDRNVLGERDMAEIAAALGAQGARRQADYVSFLRQRHRIQEVVNVSMNAQGNLEDALAIKSRTLKQATTELNNAFTKMSYVLGEEGGILSLLTKLTDALTGLIGLFNKFTSFAGTGTTAILAALTSMGIGARIGLPERMLFAGGRLEERGAALGQPLTSMAGYGLKTFGPGLAYGGIAGLATGLASGSWIQGAGAGIGTAIGATLGGPVGAMAGAFIGQAAAQAIEESAPFIAQALGLAPAPEAEALTREQILSELQFWAVGKGFPGQLAMTMERLWRPEARELTDEELITRLAERVARGEEAWKGRPTPRAMERVEELLEQLVELDKQRQVEEEYGPGTTPAMAEILSRQKGIYPGLEKVLQRKRKEFLVGFEAGDIETLNELAAGYEQIAAVQDSLTEITFAATAVWEKHGETLGSIVPQLQDLVDEMAEWDRADIEFISQMATDLMRLKQAALDGTVGIEELNAGIEEFGRTLGAISAANLREIFDIPGFTDFSEYTAEEMQQILNAARTMQEQFAQELGIPDSAFDDLDRWVMYNDDSFQYVDGLMQQFVSAQKAKFDELKQSREEGMEIMRLRDVDPSKMGEIAARSRYWVEYLARLQGMTAQQYLKAEGKTFNLILGPNNVWQQIYSTNQAMLFALQDIKEIEEKQLEGQWNIPAGATFWVPLTSLFYQKQQGGVPGLPELLPPTQVTADSTSRMTQQMQQMLELGIPVWDKDQTEEEFILELRQWFEKLEELAPISKTEAWTGPTTPTEWADQYMQAMKAGEWFATAQDIMMAISEGYIGATAFAQHTPYVSVGPHGEAVPVRIVDDIRTPGAVLQTTFPNKNYLDIVTQVGSVLMTTFPNFYAQPQAQTVEVEIPPIEGTFNITNTIMLDGTIIASYVNRILEKALSTLLRARTSTPAGGPR